MLKTRRVEQNMNHCPALGMLLEPRGTTVGSDANLSPLKEFTKAGLAVLLYTDFSIGAALDRSRNVPSDRSRDAAVSREVVVERRCG
jgi:hypothetical protein